MPENKETTEAGSADAVQARKPRPVSKYAVYRNDGTDSGRLMAIGMDEAAKDAFLVTLQDDPDATGEYTLQRYTCRHFSVESKRKATIRGL